MSAPAPRIRLGMVGGGSGAFIGGVHRIAARLDGRFELIAGALSSDPARAKESGEALGLAPERTYGSFAEMAQAEAARSDGIEAVSIVTPNHMHAAAAEPFLARGIHVICDKPLTATGEQAAELAKAIEASDALFVLTHNYTGHPLVRQARAMVANGTLGAVRLVHAEYVQDWLASSLEAAGNKQAGWRTDPAQAGGGGSIGDIGTHAINLASFITGQRLSAVAADLHTFGPGRTLDDNAHILLRFEGGASGMLWTSQVAHGNENGLAIRIVGEKGALSWRQENPNELFFAPEGAPTQRLTRGGPGLPDAPGAGIRIPPGHPEGYLEAFATIYADAADLIEARRRGGAAGERLLPGLDAGLEGMRFIEASVRSSAAGSAWTTLKREELRKE